MNAVCSRSKEDKKGGEKRQGEQKGKLIDRESESIRGNWIYRERGGGREERGKKSEKCKEKEKN